MIDEVDDTHIKEVSVEYDKDADADAKVEFLKKYKTNSISALEDLAKVVNKKGEVVPFLLWEHQKTLARCIDACRKINRRNIIISPKLRQGGMTTLCLAMCNLYSIFNRNKRSVFMAKEIGDIKGYMDIMSELYDHLPSFLKLGKDLDSAELVKYSMSGSSIRFMTSGDTEIVSRRKGRGATANYVHITEAAYVKYLETLLQSLRGSASPDATIVLESTPAGKGNFYYEMIHDVWSKGKEIENGIWQYEDIFLIFMPYYKHPEYFLEAPSDFEPITEQETKHLSVGASKGSVYYRRKEGDNLVGSSPEEVKKFLDHEYPGCIEDCFFESDTSYFDAIRMATIEEYIKALKKDSVEVTLKIGPDGKPIYLPPSLGNSVTIWTAPAKNNIYAHRYVLFADCAEGAKNSDYDCVYVLDRVENEIVAMSYGRLGAERQSDIMIKLAKTYDNAWVSWDRTGLGGDRLNYLISSGYKNLISTKEMTDSTDDSGYGVKWSKYSKFEACGIAKHMLEQQKIKVYDIKLYRECHAFGIPKDGSGVPRCIGGGNDDRIMTFVGVAYVLKFLPPPMPSRESRGGQWDKNNIYSINSYRRKQLDGEQNNTIFDV